MYRFIAGYIIILTPSLRLFVYEYAWTFKHTHSSAYFHSFNLRRFIFSSHVQSSINLLSYVPIFLSFTKKRYDAFHTTSVGLWFETRKIRKQDLPRWGGGVGGGRQVLICRYICCSRYKPFYWQFSERKAQWHPLTIENLIGQILTSKRRCPGLWRRVLW